MVAKNPKASKSKKKTKNKHAWKLYVRCASKKYKTKNFIEKIEIELHETFKKPHRVINKAPFEYKSKGWGMFEIPITIHWKK